MASLLLLEMVPRDYCQEAQNWCQRTIPGGFGEAGSQSNHPLRGMDRGSTREGRGRRGPQAAHNQRVLTDSLPG